MVRLPTADSTYAPRAKAEGRTVAAWLQRFSEHPLSEIAARKPVGTVKARVNHGRWVADCPACPSAQLAGETFVCADCGSGPFTVVWPRSAGKIEDALEVRPVANRNWNPGESLARLRAENREHMKGGE